MSTIHAQFSDRPASFDARLMAYMPMLRKQAVKRAPAGKREDLIQDTLAYALSKWQNFREDGGFCNWLVYCMRAVISMNRNKKEEFEDPNGRLAAARSVAANQEYAAELDRVLRRLDGAPCGGDVLSVAAGFDCAELGAKDGVSRQAISQRVQRTRRDISSAARTKRAYNRTKPRARRKAA